MTTTTNKQGKKTKIAPQCLCHVLFSRLHSKFQIHMVAGGRQASPRLALPCCWAIPCWALQREAVAHSRSSDSMPSPSEPSLRRWERRGYWRPWEEQRREGPDLRRPDVASPGSVTSMLMDKKRRVCAGLPPMEEKRGRPTEEKKRGSPVKRKRRGQRKIGAREGETENDEGGMWRAGSHRKLMLSGTYV